MSVSQAASAVCSSDRIGTPPTRCDAAVANESADSCLATYPQLARGGAQIAKESLAVDAASDANYPVTNRRFRSVVIAPAVNFLREWVKSYVTSTLLAAGCARDREGRFRRIGLPGCSSQLTMIN